jgi:hypothetical protein
VKRLLSRLRRIPARWVWTGGIAVVVVAGLLVWFFFLRPGGPVVVVQPPPVRPALGKSVSFDDYRKAIEDARSDIADARSASGGERKQAIEKAKNDLAAVEGASVSPPLPDGKPSQIDNTLVLGELGADEPNLAAVDAALSALGERLDTGSTQNVQGVLAGGPAVAALNTVLSDPVFDYTRNETPLQRLARWLAGMTGEADPSDTLWRWFLSIVAGLAGGALTYLATERIRNRWARLGVSALGGLAVGIIFFLGSGAVDLTFKLLGAVGLVVAAVVVALVLAGLNRASSPGSVKPISELAQVLGMSAVEARKRAEESAQERDYRSAIRYRCLAVLLALDEAGMLTFDRTATNREYLFRAPGTIHDDLQPLLDRFDQIWYGDSPTNAGEWADYIARAASMEARVAAQVRAQDKAA